MILRLVLAIVVSFAVTSTVGLILIPKLRKIKAGQSILEDGPVWHMPKQGTPTMGGIMFIIGIAAACLTVGLNSARNGNWSHLMIFAFALIYGAIGFFDDYEKLKKKQNLGLTAVQKFTIQLVVAIVLILAMRHSGALTTDLYIPFANITIPTPDIVYFILAAFLIVGTVNSVNLTDGVDGLVTGVTLPVAFCYMAICYVWKSTEIGIFAAAVFGGLLAFLIYNFNPAKIFMGDTGSLFLGGAVCGMAFALDMPLILALVGIIYILEALSDIIQVAYFKITKGKRVFKMAPLHHHFEMGGFSGKKWSEKKVFWVFSLVSAVFCVIAYYSVIGRHGNI